MAEKYLDLNGLSYLWGKIEDKVEDFVVTFTLSNDSYVADKTYAQIMDAIAAGKHVCSVYGSRYYSLAKANSSYVILATNDGTLSNSFKISNSDVVTATSKSPLYLSQIAKTISSSSTDAEPVSAKAVYNYAKDTTYTLSISGNVITLTPSSGTPQTITLPVYNGGVS